MFSSNKGPASPFSDVVALDTNDTQQAEESLTQQLQATYINPQDDSGPAGSLDDLLDGLLPSSSSAAGSGSGSGSGSGGVSPLALSATASSPASASNTHNNHNYQIRSRKVSGLKKRQKKNRHGRHHHGGRRRRPRLASYEDRLVAQANNNKNARCCTPCRDRTFVRSTMVIMNVLAKILVWSSVVALVAAVVWYSYELKNNGYVTT